MIQSVVELEKKILAIPSFQPEGGIDTAAADRRCTVYLEPALGCIADDAGEVAEESRLHGMSRASSKRLKFESHVILRAYAWQLNEDTALIFRIRSGPRHADVLRQ